MSYKKGDILLVNFPFTNLSESNVKYDKCFTIDSKIIDKKLASVGDEFLSHLKELFCNEIS